ncbi:AAA family ATPase [Sphingosinicella terrae]|uniref:AAA family ATPase n=1 Tax=Sphingosinicella terrae TaxID=2172047 RepID=UPI0013B3A080|nr:ATP-binding protein [Sphingosinicella terrae]
MLLSFTIANDRAFACESTLSLVATKLKDVEDGHTVPVGDMAETQALTSALILGKNNSGKSTLVSAMRFISQIVKKSAAESQKSEKIPYYPNLLTDGCSDQPTSYRLVFSMRGTVFDFEFSHVSDRITYERLSVADKSVRFRKMYERTYISDEERYNYTFGDALSGRRATWQDVTRDNSLFLSTAVSLNAEDLFPAWEWLTTYLVTLDISSPILKNVTARMCLESAARRRQIVSFLQALDINVVDVEIEEDEIDENFLNSTFAAKFLETIKSELGESEFKARWKVRFQKKAGQDKTQLFSLNRESTGTQILFGMAGPLFEALEYGRCLIVDEINTSLHPVIVRFLVDLFADTSQNLLRAQLIFTSHDTSVLAQHRLRRDQVWLIESDGMGAELIPLSDFSPRKGEALDKGYLGGRYGGIPVIAAGLLADCLPEID